MSKNDVFVFDFGYCMFDDFFICKYDFFQYKCIDVGN